MIEANLAVAGGRVALLETGEENIRSIEILNGPDIGNLTVNPDNTLALVLSGTDHSGPLSFSYNVTYDDGTTKFFEQTVDVAPLTQLEGWSSGEKLYMLETDDNGDLLIEHGDVHQKVYISGSSDALSRDDIAEKEGIAPADIDMMWLLDHPEYGATPEMALDVEMGMEMWSGLTAFTFNETGVGPLRLDAEPGSHWLLFEKGYEYEVERLIYEDSEGESALHPLVVTSYGEGEDPIINSDVMIFQSPSENIVINGLALTGGLSDFATTNLILDDMTFTENGISIRGSEGVTLRNSSIYDAVDKHPFTDDEWVAGWDKNSGIWVGSTDGLLMEDLFFDRNGWSPDYRYDMSTEGGLPPNMFSHNIYIQFDNTDVTFRDNITMRGASYGAQFRSGGLVEDNVYLDNNGATNLQGGKYLDDDTKYLNFILFTDNVITSAGDKDALDQIGARSAGVESTSMQATLLDNIIAHHADPNNPDEFASKEGGDAALSVLETPWYNDTIVYNWINANNGAPTLIMNADQNTETLDTALADQTTIQNFAAALMNQSDATIDDLAEYIRANNDGGLPEDASADDIIAYFQNGFGIGEVDRSSATTLRFVPNDLGDGIRWDNRINWETDDLPGTVDGDNVDLAGNWVTYGTLTTEIADFDMGSGGQLNVTSGRLDVTGETSVGEDGGDIDVDNSGQLWMAGYGDTDRFSIDVIDGRFANTGDFNGTADINVTDGQAILATSGANMTLGADSHLIINGGKAKVGFDGDDGGIATLQMEGGNINFIADETGFSTIEETRSGAFGDEPDVLSGIDLGEGVLGIDITALNGSALEQVLLGADEILGSFDSIELVGLGNDQDATITFDYDKDEVTFRVTQAGDGTGKASTEFVGDMMDAQTEAADLWAALTDGQGTYEDIEEPEIEQLDELSSLVA